VWGGSIVIKFAGNGRLGSPKEEMQKKS
jgi:hypothetical protein